MEALPDKQEHYEQSERIKILLQNFVQKLNAEPNPTEFEKTPDGKAQFLPISYIEMTLDEIYLGQWGTENFKWSAITNEVQGSLDLVLIHPITGQEIRRVGAGSIIITVDSITDEAKAKMSKQERNLYALNPENKKPNALDLGFPKLKAECVKNAAASLGKVFGRDINRKQKDVFKPNLKPIPDAALIAAIERAQRGDLTVYPLAIENFLLTDVQKEMLSGAGQKQLKQ